MKPLAKLAYHTVTVMVGVAWILATITMGVAKFQEEMASTASTACVPSRSPASALPKRGPG